MGAGVELRQSQTFGPAPCINTRRAPGSSPQRAIQPVSAFRIAHLRRFGRDTRAFCWKPVLRTSYIRSVIPLQRRKELKRAKLTFGVLLGLSIAVICLLAVRADNTTAARAAVSPQDDACSTSCAAPVAADAPIADQLAQKYAPIVSLPDLDKPCQPGGSSFSPEPVDIVLNNPEVLLKRASNDTTIREGPTSADLYGFGSTQYFGTYLDLPGDPANPGCRFERDALRFAAGQPQVTYARIARQDDGNGLVLQYWFFYYFNDWNNKHEGDWELAQLYFDAPTVEQALIDGPSRIGLSQHSTGEVMAWTDTQVEKQGDHPVVYVARGSHANYFAPGLYLGRGEGGRGFGCDDASKSERRVALEARLLPNRVSGPNDPYAWIAYKGYWGDISSKASEGSTAPITKQDWLHPVSWIDHLKTSSVSLPTDGFLGQDAARAFCNVVSFGSGTILPIYYKMPALSLFAFATFSLGIVASFASTRYLPIQVWPLRSRRRLGQILTTAVEVYFGRLLAFLTLGLIAFPLGLGASYLLGRIGASDTLSGGIAVPFIGPTGRIASLVAFGGLHAGLSAIVVTTAATWLVADTQRHESSSLAGPATPSWRLLATAVLCRLVAVAVIALLCLTLIGIPLAIRLTVRWAFLEQAILADGKPAREAFSASRDTASRAPYWVATTLLLLGVMALIAGPAVGVALIVAFRSVPPAYFNLTASIVYALLVPYLAIALTLVYFDLQLRGDGRGLQKQLREPAPKPGQ